MRSLEERFWSRVDKDGPVPEHCPELGPCWIWTGTIDDGYGMIRANGRSQPAHRVGYELQQGPIPTGLRVLHRCDNPPCVRGNHLRTGTQKENVQDMYNKGRARPPSGEIHGRYTKPERTARGDRHGFRLHPERVPRGEASGRATVTEDLVRRMRLRWKTRPKKFTLRALAKEFKQSYTKTAKSISRQTWKHLDD
jgi:hypothetical protein